VLGAECKVKNKDSTYEIPATNNTPIGRGGLILNSYPALHLQVPILVLFE
jgi:hypothetical protein